MSKKVEIRSIVYEDGKWNFEADSTIQLGHGYLVVGNEDVVCFYVDVRESPTGRAYVVSSSNTIEGFPSMTLESGCDDDAWSEVCFPEYVGYSVFATGGGKTMSICLRKNNA